jgi:hypothetical protein
VPESHQNCERLQPGGLSPEIKVSTPHHLATCQAVVLRSEIKVTFDLHNFSFASSLSHVWVTNPHPQHGDATRALVNTVMNLGFPVCSCLQLSPVSAPNPKQGFYETPVLYFLSLTKLCAGRPGFDFRQEQRLLPFASTSRPAVVSHPAFYPMGALSPGVKQLGRVADHSPSSSAKVKE